MKKINLIFIFIVGVTLSFSAKLSWANNLSVTDFAVIDTNEAANTITYTCDVSWDNSWRTTINYDAVWVFLKYSTDAGATWHHASMGANGLNPNGFRAPTGFEILVPSDEKGFFLQRTDLNSGSVTAQGVQFVWDYSQDELSDQVALASNTINKVFGVEMVYIPEGSFYAGDGASSSEFKFSEGSADDEPWYIESEEAITTTSGAADGFYYQSTGASNEDASGSIFLVPTSFPKGFQAFYLMKYELTEGQWVSFFNTLSSTVKPKRDITSGTNGGKNSDGVVNRNTVVWNASDPLSDATTARKERPVTYISWPDLLAYADWAGLRPVTELEYEKASRGEDISPLVDEFAWGKASSDEAQASEIYPDADEAGEEQIFDGNANINRNSLSWSTGDGRVGGPAEAQSGPLRAGIFAESSTNRVTSGAGFYGNMELSGNLSEMVVTVGRIQGREFLGTHGDGELSVVSGYEANATNIDWPGINTADPARGVTGTIGSGYRGGDFQSSSIRHFQVSNRTFASKDADSEGHSQRHDSGSGIFNGGRLGRTAP